MFHLLLVLAGKCSIEKVSSYISVLPYAAAVTDPLNFNYPESIMLTTGYQMQWRCTANEINILLSGPENMYMGVGWAAPGATAGLFMLDADIVIGGTDTNGVQASDRHGNGDRSIPSVDAEQNLSDIDGDLNGGTQRLAFTRPLDSGTAYA